MLLPSKTLATILSNTELLPNIALLKAFLIIALLRLGLALVFKYLGVLFSNLLNYCLAYLALRFYLEGARFISARLRIS